MQRTLSKNAVKRAVKRWDAIDQYGTYNGHPSQQSSTQQGMRDAIRDANRMMRKGVEVSPHPDDEDFFGVRLSDSPSGDRYVTAYDEAMECIAVKAGVLS